MTYEQFENKVSTLITEQGGSLESIEQIDTFLFMNNGLVSIFQLAQQTQKDERKYSNKVFRD